jgi:FMN-dependent NADH-azoreductase
MTSDANGKAMKNILLVTSSPRGKMSHSSQVATDLAQSIGGNLTVRELWRDARPAIGPEFVEALFTPETERTPQQREQLRPSDEAIVDIQAADIVVIAAGMINFGMPAALKTWIDMITRGGVTFRYSEAGPEGLLKGKRVILVLSAGGVYSSGPRAAMNFLEPALRANLEFIGLSDIETVWIEGVAFGEDAARLALDQAAERAHTLAVALSPVAA